MSTFSFPQTDALPYVAVNAGSVGSGLPVTIRAVHSQDLVCLAEVLASSFHQRDGLMGLLYPLMRMGIYEDLKSRLHSRTAQQVCLVAVRQVQATGVKIQAASLQQLTRYVPGMGSQPLVGTVELAVRSASVWQPQRAGYLYLSNLAVHVDFRHRGVAQQLLAASEQVALEWGFKNLYLHVLENNYSARRLYRRAGYRLQSVESGLGNLVLGQPKQLFLRKVLVSEPH